MRLVVYDILRNNKFYYNVPVAQKKENRRLALLNWIAHQDRLPILWTQAGWIWQLVKISFVEEPWFYKLWLYKMTEMQLEKDKVKINWIISKIEKSKMYKFKNVVNISLHN
jgi:hypothetical protein